MPKSFQAFRDKRRRGLNAWLETGEIIVKTPKACNGCWAAQCNVRKRELGCRYVPKESLRVSSFST
jgi:hypothetical protein